LSTATSQEGFLDENMSVFIANTEDDSVSVFDIATQKVINTIKVGKGPNGITFRSAGR
jgi:YVTN family beta-propeller protein